MARYNTDEEFISNLAKRKGISVDETKSFIQDFVESFAEILLLNGVLNIRKMGLFHMKTRKKAIGNIRGQRTEIPISYVIKYQSAKSLRNKANSKVRKNIRDTFSGADGS